MPSPEHVLAVVREWIVKAENDLKTAIHTLKLEDEVSVICRGVMGRY